MTSYTGVFVTSLRGETPSHVDDTLIERLKPHHGVPGATAGHLHLTISYPAEDDAQAYATGRAVANAALHGLGGTVIGALMLLPTDLFDRLHGFEPIPELLSVTDTARELEVSPQAVRQRLDAGSLRGVKAGATWVVPRAVVDAEKAAKAARGAAG